MPLGKNRNGPLNKIPEKLPLLKLSSQGQVIFPDSVLPLSFNDSLIHPEYRDIFREKPYIVLAMIAPDESLYDVAVLGKIIPEENEGRQNMVNFMGLCRVNYQIVEGGKEGKIIRWYPLHKLPIPPEILNDPEFLAAVSGLKELFAALVVQLKEELGEDAAEFFGQEYSQNMLLAVQNTTLESGSPALAVDRIVNNILNFLNRAQVLENFIAKRVIYWIPSLIILKDNDPIARLKITTEVLNNLSRILRGESMIEQNEEDLPKDRPNPPTANQQEPQQAPGTLNGKTNQGARQMIQEELAKPREAKSRFEPLKEFVKIPAPNSLVVLDPEQLSPFGKSASEFFRQQIVNQEQTIWQYVRKLVGLRMGLANPQKPVVMGFLSGPTGVGKTLSVKTLAEFLFEDQAGFTRIDCNELQQAHSDAYLIGSPPGYVAHGEQTRLSQWSIDKPHVLKLLKEKCDGDPAALNNILQKMSVLEAAISQGRSLSFGEVQKQQALGRLQTITGWQPGQHLALILFDEIEKAHLNVYHVLYRILDDGMLHLMNGETTIFRNALIVFTSNAYGREIAQEISRRGVLGIRLPQDQSSYEDIKQKLYKETVGAIEKMFPPEFIGRIGKPNIRVLHPFTENHLLEILVKMDLPEFISRIPKRYNLEIYFTMEAKIFLVKEATDKINRTLGARALKDALQQKLIDMVANLLDLGENGGIVNGDTIIIDVVSKEGEPGKNKLIFKKVIREEEPRS